MAEETGQKKITGACPGCGTRYTAGTELAGRKARCKQCGAIFVVGGGPAEVAAPAAPPQSAPPLAGAAGPQGAGSGGAAGGPRGRQATAAGGAGPAAGSAAGALGSAEGLCAICQSPVGTGAGVTTCPECAARYHKECWDYNKGCAIYGCPRSPETEKLNVLEMPVSYWGKEEKSCPQCGKVILAAAVRCRHCGATFSSARPETAMEFGRRVAVTGNLAGVRRFGIWLLVLSLVTCTAPLAAVAGPIWYSRKRDEIRALPSLYPAVYKIAIGVAVGQTALLVLVGMIHMLWSK